MIEDYIPEVEFEAHCPICDALLIHDYYWFCGGCNIVWEPDGTEGKHVESESEFEEMVEEF